MKLVGKGVYKIVSKPTFNFKIINLRTVTVETLSEYYYDILKEEKILIVDKYDNILFVGVIDKIDYNFSDEIMKLYITEYIGIIKYNSDLLGTEEVSPYVVEYTAETVTDIIEEILNGTGFTAGYIPSQTISSIEGKYLDRLEWLKLLNSNVVCGLDSNGNYTTNSVNIVSDERNTDIIVDYLTNTVTFGVRGCFRINNTSDVWIQKQINLDNYIVSIEQYTDKIFKFQRVVVIGKDNIIGSAYISTSNDTPVMVISDDSCTTEDACNLRAETELNIYQKIGSVTLKLESELFYNNIIEEGMLATISNPKNIAGEYIINEISVSNDDLTVTLGSPKQSLLSSLYDLEKRVNTIERWR